MANFEEFRIQLAASGVKPKDGLNLEEVYAHACKLGGTDPDLSSPVLAALWEDLKLDPVELAWASSDYEPEAEQKKRVLLLSEEAIKSLPQKIPHQADARFSEDWEHLFIHGKLGLMAALFSMETHRADIRIAQAAPIIERFMQVIDDSLVQLLHGQHKELLFKAFRLPVPENLSFEQAIYGLMQPFSISRSVYNEDKFCNLKPLEWWLMHEKFIPDLPASC